MHNRKDRFDPSAFIYTLPFGWSAKLDWQKQVAEAMTRAISTHVIGPAVFHEMREYGTVVAEAE
eukprot:3098120-Pleurochrysis_carterae.AAC.1